uniref:Large ribosomal subunit protein uL23m n=1 Tax=Sinocyclocheilus anshuiensis TaxID=1608454 RepID=A0A671RDZ5_9TELE
MAKRIIYPLYQLGNPQLRIFRPTFNLTLVRPGKEQPPDTVQFRIPLEMTKFDVRNYLEKIYSVPVAAVRTRIQYCTNKKRNHLNQRVKRPDYKVAYVQLVCKEKKHCPRKALLSFQWWVKTRLFLIDTTCGGVFCGWIPSTVPPANPSPPTHYIS